MDHAEEIARLTAAIEAEEGNAALYVERGKLHFRAHDFGSSLNDFNTVLRLDETNAEVMQYVKMINEILEYRCTDYYNP